MASKKKSAPAGASYAARAAAAAIVQRHAMDMSRDASALMTRDEQTLSGASMLVLKAELDSAEGKVRQLLREVIASQRGRR